jgi:hypothetical protein
MSDNQPKTIATELHSFLITPAQFQFLSNGGQKGQAAAKLRSLIVAAMNPQPPQATVPVAVQATEPAPAALLADLEAVLDILQGTADYSKTRLNLSYSHLDENGEAILLHDDGDFAGVIFGNLGLNIDSATFARYLALAANLAPFLLQERRQRLEAVTGARTEVEIIDGLRVQVQKQEEILDTLTMRFGKLVVENSNLRDAITGHAREVMMEIKTKGDMPTAYLSHPLFALFTQDMAEAFIETGAENFLTVDMHSNQIGNISATFQKEGKKTPTQLRLEAESESQRLRDRLREAEADAERLAGVVKSYGRQLGPKALEVLRAHEFLVNPGDEPAMANGGHE